MLSCCFGELSVLVDVKDVKRAVWALPARRHCDDPAPSQSRPVTAARAVFLFGTAPPDHVYSSLHLPHHS